MGNKAGVGLNILVTGCTGFVGYNLIDFMRKSGLNVRIWCLSRRGTGVDEKHAHHIQHDLSKPLDHISLRTDIDCIIHLAASMSKTIANTEMFNINTVGTLNLLEYGKDVKIKKFIFVSTGGIYGYSDKPVTEESSINPIDFYCLSKYHSELLVEHYSKYFSTSILRLFFPFGPSQVSGLIPTLTKKILTGQNITIFNDGNPWINPVPIPDVTRIISKSIFSENELNKMNVAGDRVLNVKELALLIASHFHRPASFTYVNEPKVKNLIGDNTRMKHFLRNALTSFEEVLTEYLKDFVET